MARCSHEFENILEKIPENDLENLRKAVLSRDFLGIKKILKKYISTLECLDINNITKYIVKRIIVESMEIESIIPIELTLDATILGDFITSGSYPCYTVSELIYASLFEVDHMNAHEKIYNLLEPILLSQNFTIDEKKILFIPVTKDNWDDVQSKLITILEKLDENSRKVFCTNFAQLFHLFLYCFHIELREAFVVKTHVFGKLLSLCPDLKKHLIVGDQT
ncbi:MAG: hypothetical protein QXK24_00320 [Ignisphaera sp.]|uniref:Uncharacterized protein n=1 Tax=Ignisphaera aggregans TaxID=334771 RepID=A0A7C4D3P2_9CREN